MNYKNIKTKEIKSYYDIKMENKQVSLPKDGSKKLLSVWKLISRSDLPIYDNLTEKVIEVEPKGYKQVFKVVKLSKEEAQKNIENNDIKRWKEHKEKLDRLAMLEWIKQNK